MINGYIAILNKRRISHNPHLLWIFNIPSRFSLYGERNVDCIVLNFELELISIDIKE